MFEFSCSANELHAFWADYFDLHTDYGRYFDAVDQRDEYLKTAVEYGRGMRILRQDSVGSGVSFVLSQNKTSPPS